MMGELYGRKSKWSMQFGSSTPERKKQPFVGGAGTYEGRKGEGLPPHVLWIIVTR